MNDYPRNLPGKEQLFDAIEQFLKTNSDPWVDVYDLNRFCNRKYGVIPEEVAEFEGYNDLTNFLRDSGRFAIYRTPGYADFFYISLLPSFPKFKTRKGKSVKYRIKRPWNVDREMKKLVKSQDSGHRPKSKKVEIKLN